MNLLCVDTSQQTGSLSLFQKNKELSHILWNKEKSHSEQITLSLESVLKKAHLKIKDLDSICVSIGPGSFTGLRISIALVKSLAYALDIPIYTSNSLKLLTATHLKEGEITLALINAYKNMAFSAAYTLSNNLIHEIMEPTLCESEEIPQLLEKIDPHKVIGNGAFFFLNQKENSDKFIINAEAKSSYLYQCTFASKNSPQKINWKDLAPLYLKGSAAEENLKKELNNPIKSI